MGTAAGMARLRDEVFDAILVSHEPGELDALDLIEGYRAGGAEEPIVVLGAQGEPEMAPLCYEVGADGYVCVPAATTRNLIWVVARAVQRHQLVRENRRFHQAEQVRLQREHEEARRLLGEQRALVEPVEAEPAGLSPGLNTLAAAPPRQPGTLCVPWRADLVAHYRELLRGYVIMGSGNLAAELQRLAELLVAAGSDRRQQALNCTSRWSKNWSGASCRSSRHVMTRADLLVLEVMMDLAEGYRRRYTDGTGRPCRSACRGWREPVVQCGGRRWRAVRWGGSHRHGRHGGTDSRPLPVALNALSFPPADPAFRDGAQGDAVFEIRAEDRKDQQGQVPGHVDARRLAPSRTGRRATPRPNSSTGCRGSSGRARGPCRRTSPQTPQ